VLRRFFLYLIGVGLGIIVSMFFFGDRDLDFSYLPNARTIKHLRTQEFCISDQALCQLNCIGLTESSFQKIFNDTDLDVDFGASDVDGQCRTYFIEVENEKFSKFNVDDCDSISTLLSVVVSDCECM
jgi:hypothetical protein